MRAMPARERFRFRARERVLGWLVAKQSGILYASGKRELSRKTAPSIQTDGQESWMSSIVGRLASIGLKLDRFSSAVHLSELIYVFLRQEQMKRSVQAHKSRYTADKGGAVGGRRIP